MLIWLLPPLQIISCSSWCVICLITATCAFIVYLHCWPQLSLNLRGPSYISSIVMFYRCAYTSAVTRRGSSGSSSVYDAFSCFHPTAMLRCMSFRKWNCSSDIFFRKSRWSYHRKETGISCYCPAVWPWLIFELRRVQVGLRSVCVCVCESAWASRIIAMRWSLPRRHQ